MPYLRNSTSSSLEPLESRIAPATLTGTVVSGVLKLAPTLATDAVSATLVMTDADTFELREGPVLVDTFDGVKSIKATFADLADTFKIALGGGNFRGPISIQSGGGLDDIEILGGPGSVAGDVTVTAKGAAHLVVGSGAILKGNTSLTAPAGSVDVEGVLGSVSVAGANNVLFGISSFIRGSAHVTAPDAGASVTASGAIGVNLSIAGGKLPSSNDGVHLGGSILGRTSIVLGDGTGLVDNPVFFFAGDSVSITGKGGTDTVNLNLGSAGPLTTQIGGPVRIALGDGTNSVTLSGTARLAAGLQIIGGAGSDAVALSGLSVAGNTLIDGRAGTNIATLNSATFGGTLAVAGGVGNDTLNLGGTTALGAARIGLGDGSNSSSLLSSTFTNGLTVNGGKDGDSVLLGGSTVRIKSKISLGDGANTFTSNSSSLFTSTSYVGGKLGSNMVIIDSISTLTGAFSMSTGDTQNVLLMHTLSALSSLSYRGGGGVDTVNIDNVGGDFVRGSVQLGGGNDASDFANANFVTFTLDGGLGTDTVTNDAAAVVAGLVAKNFEP